MNATADERLFIKAMHESYLSYIKLRPAAQPKDSPLPGQ